MVTTLPRQEWQAHRQRHQDRVDELLAGHRWRSSRGINNPVEDFLFEYYTFRAYQLRRWHPGAGWRPARAGLSGSPNGCSG